MESGVLRGLESTPKEVLQNFLGGQLPLAGGQTPLTPPPPWPVKYSPGFRVESGWKERKWRSHRGGGSFRLAPFLGICAVHSSV